MKGARIACRLLSASYDSIVQANIRNIVGTNGRDTTHLKVFTSMKSEQSSIVSIPHSFVDDIEQLETIEHMWTVDHGSRWGVWDFLSSKISLFDTLCTDLIAELRVDTSQGVLLKKRTRQVTID